MKLENTNAIDKFFKQNEKILASNGWKVTETIYCSQCKTEFTSVKALENHCKKTRHKDKDLATINMTLTTKVK